MSTEEITYWGFIVPKYNKDKSSYRNTSFDWNNKVLVVITTTLPKFTYATLNLFEIYFQKSEPHCE